MGVLSPLGFESVRTYSRVWRLFTMFGLTPFVQKFLGLTPFAYKLLGIDGSREPSELERAEARNKQMKAGVEAMRNKTDRVEHEHREAYNETAAAYQALESEVNADTSNRTWVILLAVVFTLIAVVFLELYRRERKAAIESATRKLEAECPV